MLAQTRACWRGILLWLIFSLALATLGAAPTSVLAADLARRAAQDPMSSSPPTLLPAPMPAMLSVPLLDGITAVTTSMFNSCALTVNGGVLCWGNNFGGQLGDGTRISRLTPVPVAGLAIGVRALAAGSMHACALTTAGAVYCWGNNGFGQVGMAVPAPESLVPTPVAGLTTGVQAIAAGENHTCALTAARAVFCWGSNAAGQLGDGSTTNRFTPAAVNGLGGSVQAITAGAEHTCALLVTGGINCWGNNAYGQLGDGSGSDHVTPVAVIHLGGAAQGVHAAAHHTCAVVAGGALCWGANDVGQLGDGTTAGKLAPVPVHGLGSDLLTGVLSLAGGESHTCALLGGGSVSCWGDNFYGQLGDGTADGHLLPTPVSTLAPSVQAISAGLRHTCVVTAGGGVACWGWNDDGQLGNGNGGAQLVPAPVYGIETAQALAVGDSHTCAVLAGGAVKCWGWNLYGQLGDATALNRLLPADVYGLAAGVQSIAAGRSHTCALLDGGNVKCWGDNSTGQLGDGTASTRYKPVDVGGLDGAAQQLAAGSSHTCAALAGGSAQCWGWNTFGQVGDGSVSFRYDPVFVEGIDSVAALSGGYAHSCALRSDSSVSCWGWNIYGQDGDGTTDEHLAPVDATVAGSGVQAVAAGNDYTCVLAASGAVQCWGSNYFGQLGTGVGGQHLEAQTVVGLASGAQAISAGTDHACAVTATGGVKCWGRNAHGELGDGTTVDRPTPVDVVGLDGGVQAVSTGAHHTCALLQDGTIQCWGANDQGQLGIPPTWTPTPVTGTPTRTLYLPAIAATR